MKAKNIAVFGIYPNPEDALEAVDTLKTAGFRNTDISLLLPDDPGTKDFGLEKETKAPEGATTGGLTGGIIRGAPGCAACLRPLSIPGFGPFLAAGPILSGLRRVRAGGPTVGFARTYLRP